MNDSSYDSLENELNDCTDDSFNNLIKKRDQENRSRESVFTLSDCDLDPPEDAQIKLPAKSQPVPISAGFRRQSPSREHSANETLCSITSGYSSTAISDVLKSSRRQRRCSEPTIGLLASKFIPLTEFHESNVRKASCDAVLSHTDEDYLEQLRSLQVEGQKLINQSLAMGIEVSKDCPESHRSEKKDVSNRLLPPPPLRLNICSRTSCSSLSSPGTSLSGSSMGSLDSAFSQFSDYSVFTPTEASSPLDCTWASRQEESKNNSVKITLERQMYPLDALENHLCQGQQSGVDNSVATGVTAVLEGQEGGSPQGARQLISLPFYPAEAKDKQLKALELLTEQSKEEEEEERSSFFPSCKSKPSSPNIDAKHKPECFTEESYV